MKKRKSLLRSDSFQTLLTSLLCIILGVAIGYVVLLIINPAGAWKSMSALLKNFFHYPAGKLRMKYFGQTLVRTAPLLMCALSILFAYKVTLPFMLNFLVTLEGTDYITASISIESYINLCLTMFIIFGCVFEMPLVTIILAKMGIADHEEGPRRCHRAHLPGRSHHHPAGHRVPVLRGSAHVPAVLRQHLPERHLLQAQNGR